jgi:hypothetical protein
MGKGEDSEELASWLKESGARRGVAKPPAGVASIPIAAAPAASFPASPTRPLWQRALLLGILLFASLQYVYADTMLQIALLPTVIVFVQVPGAG